MNSACTAAAGPLAAARGLEVWLARDAADRDEAQRLRFEVFYREMSATPTPEMLAAGRDFDRYDELCDMLLVLDRTRPPGARVVGTYRLLRQEVAEANGGFYSAGEYDLSPLLAQFDDGCRGLELGRSCVHRDYRSNATIQLLWRGIAGYLSRHSVGYMFGCASLPGTEPAALAAELSYLHHYHGTPPELRVRALPERYEAMDRLPRESLDAKRVAASLPPLIKGYLRLGAYIGDGAVVDRQFGTTDVFIVLPMQRIAGRYFSHFDPEGAIERPAGA